ncbi:hypothetical protein FRX31_003795 [Thalictrum thalictroides]|uniref:Uncharacterized protein n=1 Tax=Thalictrum thalictroides TaxID=46969 RepID=A0A7J6XCC0_THATH|nr:hypothetical protein FRX31_003795 [Thalictrum thalictroides]
MEKAIVTVDSNPVVEVVNNDCIGVEEVIPCSIQLEHQQAMEGIEFVEQYQDDKQAYQALFKEGLPVPLQVTESDKEREIFSDHIVKINEVTLQKITSMNTKRKDIEVIEKYPKKNQKQRGAWNVWGDFNSVLASNERYGCDPVHPREIEDFAECVNHLGLMDLQFSGVFFTWNRTEDNRRKGSKIDRDSWSTPLNLYGNPVYMLQQKLKSLNGKLKPWAGVHFSNISGRVKALKDRLLEVQGLLAVNLHDNVMISEEKKLRYDYADMLRVEFEDLKQKTNCTWMVKGDKCTAFFHGILKERKSRNKIWKISDGQGNSFYEQDAIQAQFVSHYKNLLGSATDDDIDIDLIDDFQVSTTLNDLDTHHSLLNKFSDEEIG